MRIVKDFLRFISGGRIAPPVMVGQRWCLDTQVKNPYERNLYTVIITDIRNGWVKWEHAADESPAMGGTDTIEHFRWLYELLPNEEEKFLPCGHAAINGIAIPGFTKPHCNICYEFIEEKDRLEFQKWDDEHMKPLRESMKKLSDSLQRRYEQG